jgi:hypothetical protein
MKSLDLRKDRFPVLFSECTGVASVGDEQTICVVGQ